MKDALNKTHRMTLKRQLKHVKDELEVFSWLFLS